MEILQYNNVTIEDENNHLLMESNIIKIYPKFEDTILHLSATEDDISSTYIDYISEIRKTYKYIHNNIN